MRTLRRFSILVLALLGFFLSSGASSAQVSGLPEQIPDPEFWRLVTELSEPSGPYTGDTWISNEASIQDVIPPLKQLTKPGGVYLGVGPEQNFTYMWALQSKIGFVIDIRRQNMLEVLLFKALFEIAPDRAEFVSRLFSRRRPAGADAKANAKALMAAIEAAPKEGLAQNIEAVRGNFTKHGYTLSGEDLSSIDFIQGIFSRGGPSITAEFASPGSPVGVPLTYTELMTATDRNGQAWSYLSSEEAYQYVRNLHRRNLIIPLVGDFGGPSTLRKISDYLKQRNRKVDVFYLSNVETYLSGQPLKEFHANVAALPIDDSSLFIRWVPMPGIQNVPWHTAQSGRVVTFLSSISELVDLYKTGRAPASWPDMLRASKDPATFAASIQDPSLRKVSGRIVMASALKSNELLRVQLVEGLQASASILEADVAADGAFTFRNVSPRNYQAIVLKGCKGCAASRIAAGPAQVVVGEKDVTDLRFVLESQ